MEEYIYTGTRSSSSASSSSHTRLYLPIAHTRLWNSLVADWNQILILWNSKWISQPKKLWWLSIFCEHENHISLHHNAGIHSIYHMQMPYICANKWMLLICLRIHLVYTQHAACKNLHLNLIAVGGFIAISFVPAFSSQQSVCAQMNGKKRNLKQHFRFLINSLTGYWLLYINDFCSTI